MSARQSNAEQFQRCSQVPRGYRQTAPPFLLLSAGIAGRNKLFGAGDRQEFGRRQYTPAPHEPQIPPLPKSGHHLSPQPDRHTAPPVPPLRGDNPPHPRDLFAAVPDKSGWEKQPASTAVRSAHLPRGH